MQYFISLIVFPQNHDCYGRIEYHYHGLRTRHVCREKKYLPPGWTNRRISFSVYLHATGKCMIQNFIIAS